jgi:hypothetical protein
MDLARIVLIAAVCFANGILLLWDWNRLARALPLGRWIETLSRRIGLPTQGYWWARSGAIFPAPGSARP